MASELLETEGIECYEGESSPEGDRPVSVMMNECENATFCVNITGSMYNRLGGIWKKC